jgi:hypothetical protein
VAPISKGNMADFELVRGRVMDELAGTLGDKLPITQLDSLDVYRRAPALPTIISGEKK